MNSLFNTAGTSEANKLPNKLMATQYDCVDPASSAYLGFILKGRTVQTNGRYPRMMPSDHAHDPGVGAFEQ